MIVPEKVSNQSCIYNSISSMRYFSTMIFPLTQIALRFTPKLVSKERMCDSVDLLLTLQNPDGGFASYELIRGPSWLEWLNPAEVFGEFFFSLPT